MSCSSAELSEAAGAVSRIDDLLSGNLKALPPKPLDSASRADKQKYSQRVSEAVALAFADELRRRGLTDTRPFPPQPAMGRQAGAERRLAGGIGAKKVDVTWTTEEGGLILGISIKSINFRDLKSKNFQKNVINRRGDMLIEAVTLHRRFPYAVLAGFMFLDKDAEADGTKRRNSTFVNAHGRLRLFTGRDDPAGRDEQYERMYLVLLDASPKTVTWRAQEVGKPDTELSLGPIFDELVRLVSERNPDFYEFAEGNLVRASR